MILTLGVTLNARAEVPGPILGPYSTPFTFTASNALLGGVVHNLQRLDPQSTMDADGWVSLSPTIAFGSPASRNVRWWANLQARIGLPTSEQPTAGVMSTIHADLRISVLPTGPVTLNVINTVSRNPSSPDMSLVALDPTVDHRSTVSVQAGTRAIEFDFSYDFRLLRHTNAMGANRDEHLLHSSLTYRFSSHSEACLRTSFEWVRWPTPDDISNYPTQMPLRVTASIEGYMTRHFWGRLAGGYATIFGDLDDRFNSGIGELEFGWDTRYATFSIGLSRTIQAAYWGKYQSQNRAFLRLDVDSEKRTKSGALRIRLEAGYGVLIHGRFAPTGTTISGLSSAEDQIAYYASHAERQGQFLFAQLTADITLVSWLALRLAYKGSGIISNFRTQRVTLSDAITKTAVTVWDWRVHLGEIGVVVFY